MAVFRRTVTKRRPRQWYAPSKAASGVTFTPSSAVSTWVVGTATLVVGALTFAPATATSTWTVPASTLSVGGVTLSPSSASSTWTVPTATLSAGALTLSPSSAVSTWTVPAASFSSGLILTPASATSSWVVGTATLSGALTLTPSPAVATWAAGTPSLTAGAVTLVSASAASAWQPGAATFGPAVLVGLLDEPLFVAFDSLETALQFDSLETELAFDSLESKLVFLTINGDEMFELRMIEGEVTPVRVTLKGRDPITGAFVPHDLTGATAIKITVRKPDATPIINARDLTPIAPATDGRAQFTPTPAETAVGGKYKALVVATYPGSPDPIVRKFPGEAIIEDAIA